jgi:hypothetical protein
MKAPLRISNNPVLREGGRDELRDGTISAVGEYAAVLAAQRLEVRATVVNQVVAVPRPAAADRDDSQVASPDEDLRVAGPAVVLRASCGSVVPCGDERSVEDPRAAPVRITAETEERRQPRHEIAKDAVNLRPGGAKQHSEFADREVCAKRGARDDEALPQRPSTVFRGRPSVAGTR